MKDFLPTLVIAAVAGVILWKLTAKTPSVEELAGAIAAANTKAAADKAAADKAAADKAAADAKK